MRKRMIARVAVAVCVVCWAQHADAAEIRVLCSNGLKAVLETIRPDFERTSGHTLKIEFNSTATLRQRIDGGEMFDVALLSTEAIDDFVKAGKLAAASRIELARTGIGVGFRKGAVRPDVRTTDAFKQAMLHAGSIVYTRDGASRPQIDTMFDSLGLRTALQPKIKLLPAGQPPEAVAKGEADIVLTLISEIVPVAGVELAGPLPADFQKYTSFAAAATPRAADSAAAKALLAFVHAPASASIYKKNGMEPR